MEEETVEASHPVRKRKDFSSRVAVEVVKPRDSGTVWKNC